MAQQYVSTNGVLVVPGAYAEVTVANQPGGLATSGTIAIIGESKIGPSFSEEEDLSVNLFGPDQISDIAAKYGEGPLVDACKGAISASADPNITGSLNRLLLVKTNTGTTATGTLTKVGGGTFGNISAKSAGTAGNSIYKKVTSNVAEVVPTTGSFHICVPQQNTDVELRVDGAAAVPGTLTAANTPTQMVAALHALAGVDCTGGVARVLLSVGNNTVGGLGVLWDKVTVTIPDAGKPREAKFTITANGGGASDWANNPTVGDLLVIPTGSPFDARNESSFVVTGVTNSEITALKVLSYAGTGSQLTGDAFAEGPITLTAITEMECYSPIVLSQTATANPANGYGKSLEVANSGAIDLSAISFTYSATATYPYVSTPSFISTSAAPTTIGSSAEYQGKLTVTLPTANQLEDLYAGGDIYLKVGYTGTSASLTISSSGVLSTTVVGGAGANITSLALSDFPTIADLVTYLGQLTGYTAAVGSNSLGQSSPLILDPGTYTICSKHGAKNGRIKADGYLVSQNINNNSSLVVVEEVSAVAPFVGQPAVAAETKLSGGTKGATTDTIVESALTALEACRCNFVVACFSRDASDDINDGLTDAASTYTIDGINAKVKSHVLLMSQMKRRRNRQAFLSIKGTFTEAKDMAGSMANSRVSVCFQDPTFNGTQYQPWMLAAMAAGMQAAGFYRPMVNKFVNISAAKQVAADFNDQRDSHLETALLAGLHFVKRDERGGYRWVSDQTSYSKDDNFVFNSIQAVYMSDTLALSTATLMEAAFVGQSVADVPASIAKMALEAILDEWRRLKIIAPSSDAPLGYKNTTIRINGSSMVVGFEAKLAGAIYFIPIYALVSPVSQSA